jgi:hypothetical protein
MENLYHNGRVGNDIWGKLNYDSISPWISSITGNCSGVASLILHIERRIRRNLSLGRFGRLWLFKTLHKFTLLQRCTFEDTNLLPILIFKVRQRNNSGLTEKCHTHNLKWHMASVNSDNVVIEIFLVAKPCALVEVQWRSFETMMTFYRIARLYNPECRNDLYVYLQLDGCNFDYVL